MEGWPSGQWQQTVNLPGFTLRWFKSNPLHHSSFRWHSPAAAIRKLAENGQMRPFSGRLTQPTAQFNATVKDTNGGVVGAVVRAA